jgi:hypothetical protein
MMGHRLPANETLAEEEEDPARALAGVDVTGVVAIAVPDKLCFPSQHTAQNT